ncbi:MAG: glycosyltransferase [Ignavibacteriales bacterium]|nr:glycosyltransferase [Ignavibacteriales bacterium]
MTGGMKIAFFAGDVDNFGFAEPVITFLVQQGFSIDRYKQADLNEALVNKIDKEYGLIWCEWGNGPVVPLSHYIKNTPIILRVHRYEVYEEWISKINWKNIHRVIFINNEFVGIPKKVWNTDIESLTKVSVIPNPLSENLPFTGRKNNFHIAHVSRFQKDKNPAMMLQILKKVVDADNRYHLSMAGGIQDMQLYDYCMHMIRELGLANNFTYAGVVANIQQWLSDKSIFLSTSIVESQGKAILEAMMMGLKPVIHNGFGGVRAVYGEAATFNTVDEAVEKILHGPVNSQQYRDFAVNNFGDSNILPRYEAVVREALRLGEAEAVSCNPEAIVTKPFFSILLFTYNRAKFLNRFMQNVFAQTFTDFEIVIVDDGSEDNTGEIMASFKDARLRYFKKEHTNAPDTRNVCLSYARADFVIWMGSDDLLPPDVLQKHFENITLHPDIDVSYGNICSVDEDGNMLREDTYLDWGGRENELLREMVLANRLPDGSSAIRKSVYDRYGAYSVNFRRAHDYEFWSRVSGLIKVKHMNHVTLQCIWHSDNMSSATVTRDTSFEERIIMGILNTQGVEKLFPEYLWNSKEGAREKAELFYKIAGRFAGLERYRRALQFVAKSKSYFALPEAQMMETYCNTKQLEVQKQHSLKSFKILMVVHHFVPHRFAGVENYVFTISRELMALGAEIHVLYPMSVTGTTAPYAEHDMYEGMHIHRLIVNGLEEFANHIDNNSLNALYRGILDSGKFSLVHIQHTLSLSFSFITIAKSRKLPVIVTLHDFWYMCLRVHLYQALENKICTGPESPQKCAACFYADTGRQIQMQQFISEREPAAKKSLAAADVIVAPSKFLVDIYKQYGFAKNIEVLPLGLHEVEPGERKKHEVPVIGFLGSIQPLKNLGFLIEAFKGVTVKAELHFYANGEEKDITGLQQQIMQDKRIQYKGAYQMHEIGNVLASVDFIVVPSLLENYPLVVREALAAGTPVVASRRGGIPEIIHDTINGLLFNPENSAELTGIMQALLESPVKLEQLRRGTKPAGYIADEALLWSEKYKALASTRPRVSVFILCFNKAAYTKKCLESLYQYTTAALFEVIAIDNGSTDETAELLEHYAGLHNNFSFVRNTENKGFARGNNQAAQLAAGEYFLLLNNDTELSEGWLEPLIKTLDTDAFAAAVGSKLLFPDGTIQHAGVGIVQDESLEFPIYPKHVFYGLPADAPNANVARSMQAVTAACMLVRAKTYNELGGLDEAFWNGYEDMDFCFRIRQQGFKIIYNPASCFTHHESKSGPERFSRARENMERLRDLWNVKLTFDFIVQNGNTVVETGINITNYQPYKKASIVIPLYNNLEYTVQCYDSIRKYTSYPYEVIFVDNASQDGTKEYLEGLTIADTGVHAIYNTENVGFPGAVNAGLKECTGDYLIIANNDILFTPGWLEKLINLSEAHPQIGITGPVSNFVSGVQIQKDAVYDTTEQMYMFAEKLAREQRGKYAIFPRVAFLCVLIKRELYNLIGGLDERFAPGNFEDDDFCLRAQIAGYATAIAKDVFIHHYGSKSFLAQGKSKYEERLRINLKKFMQKWGTGPEEIWLKGEKPRKHSTKIPMNKDVATELTERLNLFIEDEEYELAAQCLKKLTGFVESGVINMSAEQVKPFYTLAGKLEMLNKKGKS